MKHMLFATAMTMVAVLPAKAEDAVCYNCPPQWADWASMLKAIDEKLGVKMPHDNKNSGQALSQLLAEKASPVADVAYYGVTTGIKAGNEGVVTPYKPAGFDEIPAGLKDADGRWFAELWGRNLKDDDFVTGQYLGDQNVGLATNQFLLEPRTWGMTLGYRF